MDKDKRLVDLEKRVDELESERRLFLQVTLTVGTILLKMADQPQTADSTWKHIMETFVSSTHDDLDALIKHVDPAYHAKYHDHN